MKTVMAIEKREDRPKSQGESQYGDVSYADPVNKAYPIDSEKHVRAAWSYLNMPKNAAKYSAKDVATMKGRIKAAGKKYGIDFSDDDDGEKDKAESSLVYAAAIDLHGETPDEIVYMPAGDNTIKPKSHGKEITVKVDASTAETLQADLTKLLDQPIEPYAGFDHNPGPASFVPKAFKWDDARGVVLAVDWSQKGKDDVAGRNYRYFSPTFMVSGKKVAGLPDTGECGSLVNNPAFRDRKMKIAASADDDAGENEIMIKVAEKLVELEVITAEQAEDPETVVKAVANMHETIQSVQAANARLVSENLGLAAKVADVQKAEATSVIEAAIAEGKIGAKDKTSIDFYRAQLIASPETTKKVLAAMPVNPLLQKLIDVKAGDTKRMAQGTNAAELVQAQHLAVREVQEKHPGLSYQDAFNKARMERPEVFPVEASR
jgi:hypothetical protein